MLDLAFVLALTIWSAVVGLCVVRRLDPMVSLAGDVLALALPLGFGILSLATLGLGECGFLNAVGLTVVLSLGLLCGVWLVYEELISRQLAKTRAVGDPVAQKGRQFLSSSSEAKTYNSPPWEGGVGGVGEQRTYSVGPGSAEPLSAGDRLATKSPTSDRHSPPPQPPLPKGGSYEAPPSVWGEWRSDAARDPKGIRSGFKAGDRWTSKLILGSLLAIVILGTLLTSLAPVTDGDALCYHLQVPKRFLQHGATFFDPDLHETVYPLLTEMLYAVALAFRGPVACRLIQWVLGLVFALNVSALARPCLGTRAWWAGTIALLVPAISNGMSAPLNDVALAAFGSAALVAWSRYHEAPCARRACLAGVLTGFALGVKYPSLVLAALLFTTIAARAIQRRPRYLGDAACFGLVALLVGGIWYARAAFYTGNPVYPFFRHTFGGAGLDEVLDPIKRPMTVSAWNLLTALGPLTLQPGRFDSFSHQFGPLFLLFLPALLIERPPRRVAAIAALGYAFLIICLTQRQSMRFVLIALGPLSVAVAWIASRWYDRKTRPARLLLGLMVVALGFEAGLAVARARHGLGVVTGHEPADAYLARREPTFQVGTWIDRELPAKARIIGQDHRGFYIPREYTMELAHRRRTALGRHGESAVEIVNQLRAEGFTHVLFCPPVPEDAVEFDATLSRLLAPWTAAHVPIYREALSDADGVVRQYSLYHLDDERLAQASTEAEARR